MDIPLFHDAKEIDLLAQAEPGEWVWFTDRWLDASSTEATARYYLNAKEWEAYSTRASQRRPHWLMGRIAAKDAVRRWLHARGANPLPATAIEITPDQYGCPTVNMPGPSKAWVSIAHRGAFAVAICGEKAIGIDIEVVAHRTPGMEELALSARERSLLDQAVNDIEQPHPDSHSRMFTRFWAAKEAVSKAEGTGLQGKPTAFAVNAIEGERLYVVYQADKPGQVQKYVVQTATFSGLPDANSTCSEYIVAWTQPTPRLAVPDLD